MKVVNLTKNKELAHHVTMACGLFERMKGLLGRDKLMQLDFNSLVLMVIAVELGLIFVRLGKK